ncbi:MAG TPA: HEAT repeat domain-containing protein [Nitrospiraceae bacterium]|nr:HEAT repeat domain-containing protein [Nitrospiraceae bacterium]
MTVLLSILAFAVAALFALPSSAYRDHFTPEQKALLEKIQMVHIEAIALTDKGAVDAAPFVDLVARRMGELGYTVVSEPGKQHDVVIKVKCEQRKTWEGTTAAGGDADLPDAPSRLWKGPACQMTYLLGSMKIKWQKEVRTDFEDAGEAAQSANAGDPGAYAMSKLRDALENYEFPLLLAAEWGQPERLLKLLDRSDTPQARRFKIISLLGEMQADEAMPKLKEALKDRDLAKQAIGAMGNLGREGIPLLVDIMNTSPQPELQAAAAKGLGQLGGMHGDASVVPHLLAKLQDPKTDWSVLTEVAWSLGKIPDKRSIQPLYDLDKKLQAMRDPENVTLKKLKEAVFWAIKQCDTWDQFS